MIREPFLEEPGTNYENARRAHHEYYAPALVRTFWLNLFCAGLILALLLMAAGTLRTSKQLAKQKIVVLQAAADGSFDRIQYVDMGSYRPGGKVIEHFAYVWATKYYNRVRATIAEDYTDSLSFFAPAVILDLKTAEEQTQWIQTFGTDLSLPEIRVNVTKIRLEGGTGPWRMSVDFDKHFFMNGRELPGKTENWTSQIVYAITPIEQVTNDMIPVNPIGLRILAKPVETKAF